MKQIKTNALIIALLFSFTAANAQLLNKVKKAANTASNVVEGSKGVEKVAKAAKGKAAGGGAAGLKLDWNMYKMTPSITFNSLLYGTEVFTNGGTRFQDYTATFVPDKTASGAKVDVISDQDKFLKIKVYKGDQYLNYFEYNANQWFEEGKKVKYNAPTSRYMRDGDWFSGSDIETQKYGPGMYRLDFYAGDKMFYAFEFEVYKVTNNDPYADMNEMYLSRGPWNDYAYLNHAESGNLIFGFYLNHEEFYPNPSNKNKTSKPVKWSLKMFKDSKPFAQHYGNTANVAQVKRAEWSEFSCAMKSGDKGSEIKFSSLADGAYKIEVTLDNEPKPRIYNFKVKNKTIELIPEQDRTKNTDPTHLIEGWNDYVWLKLEK